MRRAARYVNRTMKEDGQYPDDENGMVLQQMAERGIDLARARVVDFEHVFPTEEAARTFEEAAKSLVMEVVSC